MIRFDGHVHSDISDGTDSPARVAELAERAGLSGFALTDHDTTVGPAVQANLGQTGLLVVPGVEISTSYRGNSAHLLAYLPDPSHPQLQETLTRIRSARENRLRQIVENISADYPQITWERLVASQPLPAPTGEATPWGRPHVADLLVATGVVPNRTAAFETILSHRGPYFVKQWAPDPRDMVELVRAAGGVPVLAHPRTRGRQLPLPEEVLEGMVDAGLFGLERDHREHDEADRLALDQLAHRWRIALTGGSDFHGSGKPNRLGENLTSQAVLEQILAEGTPLSQLGFSS